MYLTVYDTDDNQKKHVIDICTFIIILPMSTFYYEQNDINLYQRIFWYEKEEQVRIIVFKICYLYYLKRKKSHVLKMPNCIHKNKQKISIFKRL